MNENGLERYAQKPQQCVPYLFFKPIFLPNTYFLVENDYPMQSDYTRIPYLVCGLMIEEWTIGI